MGFEVSWLIFRNKVVERSNEEWEIPIIVINDGICQSMISET